MDIGKLLIAADTFFQGENSLTNHRKNVLSRAAFANAFRKHFRVVDIASVLGRDHSSIVHYKKTHSANMMYDDYIKLYRDAEGVRERIIGGGDRARTYHRGYAYHDQQTKTKTQREG
jgi:hypothetical protein